ncbi:cytochrome b561 and DOMON domain-containing protein At3g25290-like [Telopea speciosissima]|uniref:cytochrome b561 and DOMON domain-containing protein At3g25290-like n=1 Tax=Telopea speciosissima TaxID=54955 RepID=UPI001CC76BC2|nr:cytochrome b561 and DOMON domain-containing protein At3g25290-like [Telopea speciosissima]
MASLYSSRLSMILVFSILLLLQIHHSHSLTCTSQKFTGNRVYDQCNDLPELSSYLHWTYDSKNSSLMIAFVAPAKSDGWVAWAINPKKPAMIGSQALIAYQVDGNMTVKTFDVTSYKIAPSKIAYEVSDMEAENSDETMTIFATIALPTTMTTINQVWQVGSTVVDGIPAAHAMGKENLNSKGTLDLTSKTQNTSSNSSSQTGGVSSTLRNINGISIFSIFAGIWILFA